MPRPPEGEKQTAHGCAHATREQGRVCWHRDETHVRGRDEVEGRGLRPARATGGEGKSGATKRHNRG